jgi:outer membrane protein OmpA-like peptidoglycan-associated protein
MQPLVKDRLSPVGSKPCSESAPRWLRPLTALAFLVPVLAVAEASAQQPQPQPPFGPAPSAQPPGQPFQPAPGQPAPGQPGPFQPGQPGQTGQPAPGQPFGPPTGVQPGPGQPGGFGPNPWAPGGTSPGGLQGNQPPGGDTTFGGTGNEQPPSGDQTPPPSAPSEDDEWARRSLSLSEQNNMWGSTGGLRISTAGSGAPGTFRTSFMIDWFTANGFLCNKSNSTPAGSPVTCSRTDASDSASHVGAFFSLNVTPLSFLEGYATIRTYANSNNQGRPQLLQVLGDTTFGLKAFVPNGFGTYFNAGLEAQLFLLNGTGSVGVNGGSTSAAFRGLLSADLRKGKPNMEGFPFRADINFGYKLDNSGALVTDVEKARGAAVGLDSQPISRIERFGLGINRVDFFQIGVGAMFPTKYVQPFAEYSVDIPINSRGYQCHTGRVSRGDVCLGLADFSAKDPGTAGGPGYPAIPSRLSIGVRATPFSGSFRGLSGMAAFDIGLSGTSVFIEEVAPTPPWTLYLGLAYAFDTKEKPVPAAPPPQIVEKTQTVEKPQTFVRGFVHEAGRSDVLVAEAIVNIAGPTAQGPVATGTDGRFVTRNVEPGTYSFTIKASGYKAGICTATVTPAGAPTAPVPGATPGMPGQPASPMPGQPWNPGTPGPFGPFGPQPGMAPQQPQPQPAQPQGPTIVDVDCPLEALPKLGNIQGSVKDAEGGTGVGAAIVKLVGADGKETTATADGSGNFTFKDLPPGHVTLKVDASGFMVGGTAADVRPNETTHPQIMLNKRPKTASVKLAGNELKILKQVHFETNSAKILGDSNSLLAEVADMIVRTPSIKKLEIQGHTDNTGDRAANLTLSQQRAESVRSFLIASGVDGSRLVAKGYGQEKPLAPNITAPNRAKNRRVQFIILDGPGAKGGQ